MTSSFAWLDGSERQRRQMRDLLSQFKEQGTRDELGLSVIRDTFADLLFPGTGALQTRARYFFFVPWTYQSLERRRVPTAEVERRARKAELDLVDVLAATEEKGAIGVRARRNLQRLPSNIYWSGLWRLGIFTTRRSQEDFHRGFGSIINARVIKNDDGELVDGGHRGWHPKLPDSPTSFPESATFRLSRDEADFLVDRIRLAAPRSFFAWWLSSGLPNMEAKFPWHAAASADLPPHLTRELRYAQNFSEAMLGASILYNLLLSEMRKQDPKRDELISRFDKWYTELRLDALRSWDFSDFWRCLIDAGGRIGPSTRAFVETWVRLVRLSTSAASLRDSAETRALIERREAALKGALARFTNARALELWGGASGLRQLDFRWSSAVDIGADIKEAIGGSFHDQ